MLYARLQSNYNAATKQIPGVKNVNGDFFFAVAVKRTVIFGRGRMEYGY